MRKQIALLAAAAIAVNASAPVCFAKTITPNAAAAASSKSTATADTEDRSDMEKALATVKSRILQIFLHHRRKQRIKEL